MLKSLVVIAALAVAAPSLAFAQQQPNNPAPPDPPSGTPGGPAVLTVTPPGFDNNSKGPPNLPAVFNGGQPTGGSPAGGPPQTRGQAHFASP
jgi:hypothetical protein